MGRLERLTLGDCVGQELQPEQFGLWRREFLNLPTAPTSAAPTQPATPAEPPKEEQSQDPKRRRAEPDISEGWQGIWTLLADIMGGSGTCKSSKTAPPSWPTALTRALVGPLARKVSRPWRATALIVIGTVLLGVLGLLLRANLGTWWIIFAVFLVGVSLFFAVRWAAQDTVPSIDTHPEGRSNSHVNSNPNSKANSNPNSTLNSNPNSTLNSKANSNPNSNLDSISGTNPANWRLRRVDVSGAAAVKAEFTRDLASAPAATKPGAVYRGLVGATRRQPESVVFRLPGQDPDGTMLQVSLKSGPSAGLIRPFRGAILGYRYHTGGAPIRLSSGGSERVRQADPGSPLGFNMMNDAPSPQLDPRRFRSQRSPEESVPFA